MHKVGNSYYSSLVNVVPTNITDANSNMIIDGCGAFCNKLVFVVNKTT